MITVSDVRRSIPTVRNSYSTKRNGRGAHILMIDHTVQLLDPTRLHFDKVATQNRPWQRLRWWMRHQVASWQEQWHRDTHSRKNVWNQDITVCSSSDEISWPQNFRLKNDADFRIFAIRTIRFILSMQCILGFSILRWIFLSKLRTLQPKWISRGRLFLVCGLANSLARSRFLKNYSIQSFPLSIRLYKLIALQLCPLQPNRLEWRKGRPRNVLLLHCWLLKLRCNGWVLGICLGYPIQPTTHCNWWGTDFKFERK